jgi:hypothetical protein
MDWQNFLYGRRDPQEAIRRRRQSVAAEFARVETLAKLFFAQERDRILGISEFNGRYFGQMRRRPS